MDFLAMGAAWSPKTGELFTARQDANNPSRLYAVRLRDGRLRRLGMEVDEVRFSPDYRRMACVRQGPLSGTDSWQSQIWTAAADGTGHKALTTGSLFGWTDESHLLITRAGSAQPERDLALFRADVNTGDLRYLAEYPAGTLAMLSPSRRWIAVAAGRSVKLISAEDGRWSQIPTPEVTGLFWGRTDGELYLGSKSGWRKLDLRIGPATEAAILPAPERLSIRYGSQEGSPWRPLQAPSSRWRVYRGTAAPRSAARVAGTTWIGTTDGLKVLDSEGKARPVPPWARGLTGRSVEAIVPDGARVWLLTRRVAPFNGRNSWESAVVSVDLHTGKAQQRYLEPSGFGGEQYLTAVVPGEAPITVAAPQHEVRRWSEQGTTELLGPDGEQPLAARTATRAHDGTIWLGTDSGVVRWRPGEEHATAWTEKHGLAAAVVLAVAEHRGRIWLGTSAGLSVLDPRCGRIQRLTAASALGREPVFQLLVSGDTLYARGRGWLAEQNPRTGGWTRWPASALTELYASGKLLAHFGDGHSLQEWRGQGRWKPLSLAVTPRMAADTTSRLLRVEGMLWCGHPHAVSRLDLRTGKWLRAALPRGAFQVQSLVHAYGSLWVGLWRGGVLELDPATGALRRRYLKVPGDEKLRDDQSRLIVHDLTADGGDLFANTSMGWHRLDRKSGHARLLPHGIAGSVAGKMEGRLWVLGDEFAADGEPGLTELTLPGLSATPHPGFPPSRADACVLDSAGIVWNVGSEVVGRNRDGKIVKHYPVPRRYRDLSVQAVTWSAGYVWYAAEGQEGPVPYQPVFLRLRLADGVWQELSRVSALRGAATPGRRRLPLDRNLEWCGATPHHGTRAATREIDQIANEGPALRLRGVLSRQYAVGRVLVARSIFAPPPVSRTSAYHQHP